ncbi:putative pentatricopeptide repeat-containing protein [Zea mays]|uniref:Putative pentatricopeptide repeat-containing protein n=1 Tax=Zea mays TaxID=4577 RepID=A0A3L6E9S2_MAIZE|nr:putative pentatricopeptide repeat-containing protein [Zea mays]
MVTAYAQNAMPVKALEPFEQMEVAGMPIDEASLTGAICSARIRLLELRAKLNLASYVPVLSSVVYNVSEEEKERLSMGHSEKLALSFGFAQTRV